MTTLHIGLPGHVAFRYEELVTKRRSETLTEDEYSELLCLTSEVEGRQLKEIERLSELARMRQISLSDLMDDLETRAFPDA